jgi:cell division protein FtsW
MKHVSQADSQGAFRVSRGGSESRLDPYTITIIVLLLFAGSLSVYSASMAHAMNEGFLGHYLVRHLVRALVGFAALMIASTIDYRFWKKLAWPLGIVGLLMLMATLTQSPLNGAKRWLRIGSFAFQPIDLSKFAFLLVAALVLSRMDDWKAQWRSLVPLLVFYVLMMITLLLQPNKSMMIGITGAFGLMVFIAGVPISWVIAALASAFSAFAAMLMLISNSQARIVDWLQSLTNPLAGSNQQVQALIALGRGGFVGQGPGNSMQKLFYVAEPFNDFIFAIFGEEYGFVGCAVIVLLYLLLFLRGLQIVRRSQDPFARMLALGIIGIFFMHSVINIYVATGLFPVTGQTLPLFSYGGTSMITMLGALGILLNISYQARKLQPGREMK